MNTKEVVDVRETVGEKIITTIERTIHIQKGWRWVWFEGRRYQVHGGFRTEQCIYVDRPIPTRDEFSQQTKQYFPYAFD